MASMRSFLIFLITLALGVALGLYLGWVALPVQYVDTAPDTLRQADRDEVILMIAVAYAGDANIEIARARFRRLGLADPGPAIVQTAQRALVAGAPESDLRALARLAAAFNTFSPLLDPYRP